MADDNPVNRETNAFDHKAATWDDKPRRAKLARDVARAIRDTVKITPEMDVLDFGCGTGLFGASVPAAGSKRHGHRQLAGDACGS